MVYGPTYLSLNVVPGGEVGSRKQGRANASESDRTSRNRGMTRLVRRSSAGSGGTAFFSLVQTFRPRMRKCSGSPIRGLPKKKLRCWFRYKELTFQLNRFYRHKLVR